MGWGRCVQMKLEDKKRIVEMYANGVNAKDIANRICGNYDNVRKYIQRNLKHLKEQHQKQMERDNAILRTTLMECNRAITSTSFIDTIILSIKLVKMAT